MLSKVCSCVTAEHSLYLVPYFSVRESVFSSVINLYSADTHESFLQGAATTSLVLCEQERFQVTFKMSEARQDF